MLDVLLNWKMFWNYDGSLTSKDCWIEDGRSMLEEGLMLDDCLEGLIDDSGGTIETVCLNPSPNELLDCRMLFCLL